MNPAERESLRVVVTAYTGPAGRVAAGGFRRPRKVRTPQGRTLGKPKTAKADGKWHRKETAGGENLSGDAEGKGETVG